MYKYEFVEPRNLFIERCGAVGIFSLIGYGMLNSFSEWLAVDWETGASIIIGCLVSLILLCVALWNELNDGLFGSRLIVPLALSTLWISLWPLIQILGALPIYMKGMPFDDLYQAWWSKSYLQPTGAAVIFFGGYGLAYWTWVRD